MFNLPTGGVTNGLWNTVNRGKLYHQIGMYLSMAATQFLRLLFLFSIRLDKIQIRGRRGGGGMNTTSHLSTTITFNIAFCPISESKFSKIHLLYKCKHILFSSCHSILKVEGGKAVHISVAAHLLCEELDCIVQHMV